MEAAARANASTDLIDLTELDLPLEGHFRDIGLTTRKGWRATQMQARYIEYLHRFSRLSDP